MQTSRSSEGDHGCAVKPSITSAQVELTMSRDFVIGMGSNLGAREVYLTRAVEDIARLPSSAVIAVSRVYESPPLGPPQPHYLNAAVRVTTALAPDELLDAVLDIEARHGRVRDVRWGPRVLDLDILWAEDAYVSKRLTIPHAELPSRTFALAPLLDVAPELAQQYLGTLKSLDGSLRTCGILRWDRALQKCEFEAVL
jgi:2-amino-4-hydroxy-6-hydroxymethyldihydropteridine diphosphokinase